MGASYLGEQNTPRWDMSGIPRDTWIPRWVELLAMWRGTPLPSESIELQLAGSFMILFTFLAAKHSENFGVNWKNRITDSVSLFSA